MAGKGKSKSQQSTETVQDFSNRYPGGEQVAPPPSEWFAFESVGDELVGEWEGLETFKNGMKGSILTDDGPIVFSASTLLRQQLKTIRVGERIAIVLAGFQASNKESPMKVYQVFRVRK